jgi:hypothetical protein
MLYIETSCQGIVEVDVQSPLDKDHGSKHGGRESDETGDAQPEEPPAGDPVGSSQAAGDIPPTHKEEKVFYNRFYRNHYKDPFVY